jgi:hypothetical protein
LRALRFGVLAAAISLRFLAAAALGDSFCFSFIGEPIRILSHKKYRSLVLPLPPRYAGPFANAFVLAQAPAVYRNMRKCFCVFTLYNIHKLFCKMYSIFTN